MADGMVTLKEACSMFGVSDLTLRRRIRAGEITVHTTALDRRRRLVDLAELGRYAEPRPLAPTQRNEEGPSDTAA